VVPHPGCRPEPSLPVEPGGWVFVRRVPDALRPLVLDVERTHGRYFPDLTGAHEIGGFLREGSGSPHQSDLRHPTVTPSGFDHPPTFLDRQGKRLFDVNVLSGLAGLARLARVPMFGRTN